MTKLLLIEDDLDICEIIHMNLSNSGYDLVTVHSAPEAFEVIRKESFDLILLDIMLPGMNGLDICREIRKTNFCPIIFISCLDDESTIINALELGGDDYLVKPFNFKILQARIESILRRSHLLPVPEETSILTFKDIHVDLHKHAVEVRGRAVYLSPFELKILVYLMKNPEKVVPLEELYQNVWGDDSLGDVRTVKVHVSNLRKKLEEVPQHPEYIRTVKRIGYMLTAD